MNRRIRLFVLMGLLIMLSAAVTPAQDEPSGPPPQQGQGRGGEGRQRPLVGKIAAMRDGAMDITGPDGQVVTVKLTAQTEFRKDREPVKISDFKVGDMVMVRGDENADHSVTARMIGARTGGTMYSGRGGGPGEGPGGRQGGGPGGGMTMGTLGKDYVAGEVKAIDPPKLTVLRTDNVTQVLELDEETSLRKGRDSITMADIQVGDHVMARGGVQSNAFVPKGVMVLSPEQWQRMQEMMSQGNTTKPAGSEAAAPKPQE